MGLLNYLLAHPLTRGLDIDDPMVTLLRKKIIQSKPFLKNIYKEWYENGNLWINANHKDDEVYGEFELYYPSGQLHTSRMDDLLT